MASELERRARQQSGVAGRAAEISSVMVACVGLLTGCDVTESTIDLPSRAERAAPTATAAPTPTPAPSSALTDLEMTALALPTIDEVADVPQYRRADFGDGWVDVDRNGCSTRQDILRRDLEEVTLAHDGCTVLAGTLEVDPYSGATITFSHDRIGGDSQAVQIDHIVSLSAAHRGGAWTWSLQERVAFANDPVTLLAVDGPTNSAKSDRGPADWMPEDPGFWCDYAADYTAIVSSYGLAVSAADKRMLIDVLAACA